MSVSDRQETLVVIGNGMVGHRFIEKMVEFDTERRYRIVSFCEEPRAAYDRVGLTSFFAHRDAEKLMLARLEWYRANGVDLHIGDRADRIDRRRRVVLSQKQQQISFDRVVIATGSYPFVPPIPGINKQGVFVYRTIEDLERIIRFGESAKRCAVMGGGLLGLEAAKAAYDLGLETHVIEFADRLMPRQLDMPGAEMLRRRIQEMGVHVHLDKSTKEISGKGQVEQIVFGDDDRLAVEMIIVSCGIRPRDELARDCGLDVGERGGIIVNDLLQTSDPDIYAVGEVALHGGQVYGLVAPGYQMSGIVAGNLTSATKETERFTGTDLSAKLKLMGVDVASFGDHEATSDRAQPLTYEDPFEGIYRKLLFSPDGKCLLGGILVGDASDYGSLSSFARSGEPLPCTPAELMGTSKAAADIGADSMGDDGQVCSCNNVLKGQIREAIRTQDLTSIEQVKACTSAGTGCGGCLPLVADIFKSEMQAAGVTLENHLCEHFCYSRQELFDIVKIKEIKTFDSLLQSYGTGQGCEVCKPAIASILASLWNENVMEEDHHTLQDTNDRFLANMQRGGLYSVVPRVPAGEITPDKLIALGEVGKKYGLYTKITGGQRVDLFGAQLHQLPDIWEELIDAGFESGHAYGKAVRTVKSCVGTTWCRFGVQDSVGFAIRVEQRYRGIRAPHKIKFAVSGCVRECAEAQCKDVGLVATENGYNLYVCGNGGAKPRHADLLVADIDEETAIQLIDRVLMYYIFTADKLTRTATWLEKMEGGIDQLRRVVLDDALGVCDELERRMQYLVDTYECEWKRVVEDPERRKLFRQFVNTRENVADIEFVDERGQCRPADWPKDGQAVYQIEAPSQSDPLLVTNGSERLKGQRQAEESTPNGAHDLRWFKVGQVTDFPKEGGAAIKYGDVQIAVFNFASRGEWYACQNMCPHKKAFVLSRGIIGTGGETPRVACPLHKKLFSLKTGKCESDENYAVKVFSVKIEDGGVYLKLPPRKQLDAVLATEQHIVCAERCEV